MAASDALAALATRAKIAEDHVAASKNKARTDIQTQVDKARTTAEQTAQGLQAHNAEAATQTSQWWSDVQLNWSQHVAEVRQHVASTKADLDVKKLQHRADNAESDAVAAVAYAEAALEEAEYAVLDAELARVDADAAQAGS